MTQRFAYLDVHFCHKKTFHRLLAEFGPWGPLVFIALILEAKNGNPPGTLEYPTESVGWSKLGFENTIPDFTLDEFFAATGRLRQTRKTSRERQQIIVLSQWERWQNERRSYVERERKSRNRALSKRDTNGTPSGTPSGTKSPSIAITSSIPLTPREKGTNSRARGTSPRQNGTAPRQQTTNPKATAGHTCPKCHHTFDRQDHLETHLEWSGCSGKYDEASAGA